MRRIDFAQFTKTQAAERMNRLRAEITHHRYLYHVMDTQEISDAALDSLKRELVELEEQFPELVTANSPTQRVAGAVKKGFKKVSHEARMLSIEDAFSRDDVTRWLKRLEARYDVSSPELFCEVKMDGLALAVRYEHGELAVAVTRGTGEVGEDVTHNAKAIEAIPLTLRQPTREELESLKGDGVSMAVIKQLADVATFDVEIRGEAYFPKDTFEALNDAQRARGDEPFANPRNAAAGTMRQLDPSVTVARGLGFFGYAIARGVDLATHEAQHRIMPLLGIPVNAYMRRATTLNQVEAFYHDLVRRRHELNYWTDGIVLNINDQQTFDRLGVAGKAPRGALAWKYPAIEATTRLVGVAWSVGRTGALTPVAMLEPVQVAGTTVARASLHNLDEIRRLDARIDDTVVIHKAGDIIPKVVRVLKDLRNGREEKIEAPTVCPMCDQPVERREDEVAIVCVNRECFARLRQRILYAISKNGFDIDGLGERTIDQLLERGLIHNTASVFELTQDDLLSLEGFAAVSARKLYEEIQRKRAIALPNFLAALGIAHVGSQTALRLAEHFGSLEAVMRAKKEDLIEVEDVGDVVADAIVHYFSGDRHRRNIADFIQHGGQITSYRRRHGQLDGKRFVFTGTLNGMSRAQAHAAVAALGGIVSASVGANTHYVVMGARPGSKARQARRLGVKTLSEREFIAMIGAELD